MLNNCSKPGIVYPTVITYPYIVENIINAKVNYLTFEVKVNQLDTDKAGI